jgi:hypothetical protein
MAETCSSGGVGQDNKSRQKYMYKNNKYINATR